MPENTITVHSFSPEKFIEIVCPRARSRGEDIPVQVKYLARYCEQLGVRTLVHEGHYMDRHYVDEYALYYSRMLSPPANSVQRIHFFARAFTEEQFVQWLERSFRSPTELKSVERELMHIPDSSAESPGYLGYCSIRPVESVPIGRTIIARLRDRDGQRRDIYAVSPHSVHIGNLKLHVEGLAFQQQDAAVGACATAALWTALIKIARQDGMRAPTPAEISEAAIRTTRAVGRPLLFANTGLTVQQLCEATRSVGFANEVISARSRPEIFMVALHSYLLSGIPVVLALRGGGRGHAVTAAGFQLSTSEHPSFQASIPVRSARMSKIYVHDDRLGPYARANIEPFAHPELGEGLIFEIEWEGRTERWIIDTAIVAIYPKLRLPVSSLIALAEFIGGPVEKLVGKRRASSLRVDFRYERTGEYLSRLSGRVKNSSTAAGFIRRVSLSRWCAIIRWYLNDVELIEFVYDTTDVVRDVRAQNRELLRAIVCLSSRFAPGASAIADALNVSIT